MYRFIRRIIHWYNTPLPEDERRYWYNRGRQDERVVIQQELGPIMHVTPWQPPHKQPEPLILGIRERANLANFRRLFLVDKDDTKEVPSIQVARKHPLK